MKRIILLLTVLVAISIFVLGCISVKSHDDNCKKKGECSKKEGGECKLKAGDKGKYSGEMWTCAMHPEVKQHSAGTCSSCGMKLTKFECKECKDGKKCDKCAAKASAAHKCKMCKDGKKCDKCAAKAKKCDMCKPGKKCDMCKMKAAGKSWTCSMHPEVKKQSAGTCPSCGMKLVKSECKMCKPGKKCDMCKNK